MVRAMNYIASIFCTFIICHPPQKSSAVQKVYKRPLRRFAPALPEGDRSLYGDCQSLSLWERWQCEALTERASPSPESRHAAISCLFGRAMLSLRLRFSGSVLALSVTFGDSSPKGGATGVPVSFRLDAESPTGRKRAGLATEGRLPFVQPLRHR